MAILRQAMKMKYCEDNEPKCNDMLSRNSAPTELDERTCCRCGAYETLKKVCTNEGWPFCFGAISTRANHNMGGMVDR